jgi:hypothetical protein
MIKAAVHRGVAIPTDSRREVLMGINTPCISKRSNYYGRKAR